MAERNPFYGDTKSEHPFGVNEMTVEGVGPLVEKQKKSRGRRSAVVAVTPADGSAEATAAAQMQPGDGEPGRKEFTSAEPDLKQRPVKGRQLKLGI